MHFVRLGDADQDVTHIAAKMFRNDAGIIFPTRTREEKLLCTKTTKCIDANHAKHPLFYTHEKHFLPNGIRIISSTKGCLQKHSTLFKKKGW